jgi:hypothetical protein
LLNHEFFWFMNQNHKSFFRNFRWIKN